MFGLPLVDAHHCVKQTDYQQSHLLLSQGPLLLFQDAGEGDWQVLEVYVVGVAPTADTPCLGRYLYDVDQVGAFVIVKPELIDEMVLGVWLDHEFVYGFDDFSASDLVVEALNLSKVVEFNGGQGYQAGAQLGFFGARGPHLNIINTQRL